MATFSKTRPSGRGRGLGRSFMLVSALILLGLSLTAIYLLFELERPVVRLGREIRHIGARSVIPLEVKDRRSGIRQVEVCLIQGDRTLPLHHQTFARQAWLKQAGPSSLSESIELDIAKAGGKEGEAELLVSVRDFSLFGLFQGNLSELREKVVVDTRPPVITIRHAQRAIRSGGAGIVVYQVSEPGEQHGVRVDDRFFPGFPVDPQGRTRIAYLALPWDAGQPKETRVVAMDQAGNEGSLAFPLEVRPAPVKRDRIEISDAFLDRKIPEFQSHYPEMSGSPVDKYLYANRQVRLQNAAVLEKLCAVPVAEQLWQDRFFRMPGATQAGFADQRTYYHQGQVIDEQTHLGVDIASRERAEIRAANRGKVVHAAYLGVYGNMVLLDHGQGLFSLYSHLSSIETSPGRIVAKNEVLGHSGTSGMAGGDHLHFSILVHGIFVNPIEWWDQHWIEVNIEGPVNQPGPPARS